MASSSTAPATDRLVVWSRQVLVALAFLFLAGITAKMLASGSTPFGWSEHWSEREGFGQLLRGLAYGMWVPALLGRVGRRFVVGAVLLAVTFPSDGQALTLVSALALVSLPLWIGLRTLDGLRLPPGSRARSAAA